MYKYISRENILRRIYLTLPVCLILLTETAFKVEFGADCQHTSHQRVPSWTTSTRDVSQALLLAPGPSSGYEGNNSKNLSSRIVIDYQRRRRAVFSKRKSSSECISDIWETGERASDDRRTVCSGLAVHSPGDLPALRKHVKCDIINGNLEIAYIGMIDAVNWTEYSLPRVREITGFLLVYNVFELPSLSTLLPALAVIRGNKLLGNHALVVTKTSLQELGLISLQAVLRGSIFVHDNIDMRFTDTVDFGHLTNGSGLLQLPKNMVQRDPSSSEPRVRCPSSCSSDSDRGPRCWSALHCQAICSACSQGCVAHHSIPTNQELNLGKETSPSVAAGEHYHASFADRQPSATRSTSVAYNPKSISPVVRGSRSLVPSKDRCCPSERDCVGGCSYDEQQRWRGCNACQHYRGPYGCVTACPDGHRFLYQNYFCLTHNQCQNRTGHKPLWLEDQFFCLRHCPTGYREGRSGVCIPCNAGQCGHECPGGMVTSISTLQAMRGCSNITGPLIIRMPALNNLNRELELALGRVVSIRDYLQIDQSVGITSLRCLGRLERIAGETLYQGKYALYVNTNEHLRELWLSNHRLSLAKGSAVFVNNPRLCPALITGLLTPNRLPQPLPDHLLRAVNGHALTCGDKIGALSAKAHPDGSVGLKWGLLDPHIASRDNILGFFVYFRETSDRNLSIDKDASNCNREWLSRYVDRGREVHSTELNNSYSLPASVLKPYTQYALYLETYSSDTGTFHSDIAYTKTAVAAPGTPEAVRVRHSSSSSLEVSWRPPTALNGRLDYYIVTYSSLPQPDQAWDHDDSCGQEDCHERQIHSTKTTEKSLKTTSEPLAADSVLPALLAADQPPCPAAPADAPQVVEPIELDVQHHLVSSQHCTAPAQLKRRHLDEDAQGALFRKREEVEEEGKRKKKVVQDRPSVTSNETGEEMNSSVAVDWQTVVRGGKTLHAVISRLRHHTYYRVQVRACNYLDLRCAGKEPPARCTPLCSATPDTHLFRTDSDPFADSVTSVTVAVTADGALQVSWQPPAAPNSPPRAYRLTVTRGNLTVMGHCLPPGFSPSLTTDRLPAGSYVLRIVTRTAAAEGVPYTAHFTVLSCCASQCCHEMHNRLLELDQRCWGCLQLQEKRLVLVKRD